MMVCCHGYTSQVTYRIYVNPFFLFLYTFVDLEWKVLYVSSAENSSLDQTLDEILVGPVPVGVNKFVLEVEAPVSNDFCS